MKRYIMVLLSPRFIALHFFLLVNTGARAAETASKAATAPAALSSPVLYILLGLIVVLLLAILVMGESIKAAARIRKNSGKNLKTLILLVGSLTFSPNLLAVDPKTPVTGEGIHPIEPADYWGLDSTTFFALCAIIAFELLIFFILRNISLQLLRDETENPVTQRAVIKTRPRFIEKLNASIPIEKEEEITLDHEYDGIRELDNNLPPWWKYGFYVSIVFAFIYLVHYHITRTGKLQLAEYEAEIKKASEDIAEYRKNAASQVTEANVTLLTDEGTLSQGKSVFLNNCAACHGKAGEGGVGPNLTDDYWLHSGSIKDVFISVKYGWPEKGMKAWEQDLSPVQIHQVSSYIKSLHGTQPANPKEKQGELYIEEKPEVLAADSTLPSKKIK